MQVVDVLLIGLVAVAALAMLARRLGVPYPVLLLLGGAVLAVLPGLPRVTVDPEVVFVLFVPPLVFASSWETSWRDLRDNLLPIGVLAVGLVLATMAAVAVVARLAVPGMTWAAAFVLGAIVSPTDVVATDAIAARLRLPRRLVTILSGESALNDAVSLVAYRVAVAAVVTGTFSLPRASIEVVVDGAGGAAVGLGVAWLYGRIQRRIEIPQVEVTLTLLLPYAAFIPAERFGLSGVLAVVVAGVVAGRGDPTLSTTTGRLKGRAFWDILVFLLQGLIFILLGLQLPAIVEAVASVPATSLAGYAAIVVLAVVLVRVALIMPATVAWPSVAGVQRHGPRRRHEATKRAAAVAWAGMRGANTLVVALALPLTLANGEPFPDRGLLLFLTFLVILATLVGQGLSLPWLIRRLGLAGDGREAREAARARVAAAAAAIARLDERAARNGRAEELTHQLRGHFVERSRRFSARHQGHLDAVAEAAAAARREVVHDLVAAQRRVLIDLRDKGEISDHVLRELVTDLDLQAQLLEAEPAPATS